MVLWLASLKNLLSVAGVTGGYPVPRSREGSLSGITPDYTDPAAGTDIFERGAWWKNRVSSHMHPLNDVRRCACGNCRECVSRVYETQVSVFRQTVAGVGGGVAGGGSGPELRIAAPDHDDKQKEDTAGEENADRKTMGEEDLGAAARLLLARLRYIDAAVRRHERAHLALAGSLARGGANYDYRQGPDGKKYAVGGDVRIDVSKAGDPEKTISKMERVRAAALAPAVPSAQDRRVAASASLIEMDARRELKEQEMMESEQEKQRGESTARDQEETASAS